VDRTQESKKGKEKTKLKEISRLSSRFVKTGREAEQYLAPQCQWKGY